MAPVHATEISRRQRLVSGTSMMDVIPVLAIACVGALTIAFWTGGGPRGSHIYWLSAVLIENALALLPRRRHPVAALAGVLAAYVVFDYLAIALLPMLLALATVAMLGSRRLVGACSAIAALAVFSVPVLHGDAFDRFHVLLPLAALALALALGELIRRGVIPGVGTAQRQAVVETDEAAEIVRMDERQFRPSSDSAVEAEV